jgi:hypothetical protein
MQVIPKFVSTDQNGSDPQEFLLEYFDSPNKLYSKIFLKGYQWPFDVKKVIGGSSIIDILVHIETVECNRRVFLDYRENPKNFDFAGLSSEAREYLEKSDALFGTPINRLEKMNPSAIELYAVNGIDLRTEPLEIAVCAQHNNGGLAGTIWWESTNIKHLFPIGEVNGSHGVTRPGGSALNSGQVGAFRAAEYIANRYAGWTLDIDAAIRLAAASKETQFQIIGGLADIKHRMSQFGALIRRPDELKTAVENARRQLQTDHSQLCLAHTVYLDAILYAINSKVGSRGSGLVIGGGLPIYPKLDVERWNMLPENEFYREKVMLTCYDPATGEMSHRWEPRRPIPEGGLWFETAWKAFRERIIYE